MRVFEERDLMVAETTARVTDADGNLFNVKAGTRVPPGLIEAYIEETGQEPEDKGQPAPDTSTVQTKPERHTMQEKPERAASEGSENPITKAAAKKAAARRRSSK
jgi:hypothetical protein